MASGFFLGGLGEGLLAGMDNISRMKYQQGLLQLEQQRQQQSQQNDLYAKADKQRSELIDHIQSFADQYNIAHQNEPPEVRTKAIAGAVSGLKQQLMALDKTMKRDPAVTDALISTIAATPSKALTEAKMAAAKEPPGAAEERIARAGYYRRGGLPEMTPDQGEAVSQDKNLTQRQRVGLDPLPPGYKLAQATQTDASPPLKKSGVPYIDSIVKGIDNGDLPPDLKGLYGKNKALIEGALEDNGIKLAEKQLQWRRAEKQIQSLNGPQMTRYIGLNKSVQSTIDEALTLSKQMHLSGIPALNAAELQAYIQTQGNSQNGQLATKYVSVINTLKEEFANLANGGYAPTEPAWKLAEQQINGNYGWQQLPASLSEIKKLMNIRLNAIPGMETLGPGAGNKYTGQGKSEDSDFQEVPGFPGVKFRQVQ